MTRADTGNPDDDIDRLNDELDRAVKGRPPEPGAHGSPFRPTIDQLFALASVAGVAGIDPARSSTRTRQSPPIVPERRFLRPLPDRIRRFPMSVTSTAAIVAIVVAITFSTFQSLGTDPSRPSPSGSRLSASTGATPDATPSSGANDEVLEDCAVPVGDVLNVPFGVDQGTPGASTPVPQDTASPVSIVIEGARVDASVEKRNIIDGVMEAPSGPTDVAWYQQTDLLGEVGNVVMVGYVDYFDVGPAVFFHLQDLEQGDEIVATGTDGNRYVYTVERVELYEVVDMTDETVEEIVGPTQEASITLITCGGEFDYDRGVYLSRTVVRGTLTSINEGTPVPAR